MPVLILWSQLLLVIHSGTWRRQACLLSNARPTAGAEEIGAFDDVTGDRAIELVLDDVRTTVSHALESVGEVETVADLLGPRLDEVELSRVGEPPGNKRRCIVGSGPLAHAGRKKRPKRDARRQACRNRRLVSSRNGLDKPRPNRTRRHHMSLETQLTQVARAICRHPLGASSRTPAQPRAPT